jgi:hypothetical protein
MACIWVYSILSAVPYAFTSGGPTVWYVLLDGLNMVVQIDTVNSEMMYRLYHVDIHSVEEHHSKHL